MASNALPVPAAEYIGLNRIVAVAKMLSLGGWHENYAKQRLPELLTELEQVRERNSSNAGR